jgi:hypothetical protein
MPCDTVELKVDKFKFDELKDKLLKEGVKFTVQGVHMFESGELKKLVGVVEGKGIQATFIWESPDCLTYEVVKKPWYISCGKIRSKFEDALKNK